ncbi:MAG: molybdenum biosynthesis protein MoaD [Candidatus Hecatellales archaeon B24]|nr:MAG: molybdenum biosynthesis protein MoaD [Candidatus Hecatellales archaeon B24]
MEEYVKVKVEFFTTLRDITGKREEVVRLPPKATVGELLDSLSRRYGPKFVEYVFEKGEVRPNLIVMVDGKSIALMGGLKAPLKDGNIVAILPAFGGG